MPPSAAVPTTRSSFTFLRLIPASQFQDESGQVSVKVGDTVIISKYGGTQVKYEDVEYTILREDDILGIIA